MMTNLQANHHIISTSRRLFIANSKLLYPIVTTTAATSVLQLNKKYPSRTFTVRSVTDRDSSRGSALVQQRPPSTDEELGMMVDQTAEVGISRKEDVTDGFDDSRELEYLVREYGWKVRRMVEEEDEMRKVAQIQADAFHVPSLFFDDLFFQFFQAEVLAGLLYRLRHSPPDRYACLVAEPAKEENTLTNPHSQSQADHQQLVGVVDVTVLRDNDVVQHLQGAQEYLYVSGIAVSNNHRRQKVATALLKACEVISFLWGYQYLVLRAYEDDLGARTLYSNAGYRLVSRDPPWVTWIGRRRRILMMKCLR